MLEVAIGTGLNLEHYPANVTLTGIDWSPEMLDKARQRAAASDRAVVLYEGDAQAPRVPRRILRHRRQPSGTVTISRSRWTARASREAAAT